MNKAQKFLKKLNGGEKHRVLEALKAIECNNLSGFNVKRIKGNHYMYRVRIGRIRIIFSRSENSKATILFVGLRSDVTYN